MNFLVLLLLLGTAQSAIYYKLTSVGTGSLSPNDYLTSALGHFRLTLNPQTCQLQIQSFQGSNYQVVGYYPRSADQACSSVSIESYSLKSSTGKQLLSLRSGQLGSRFDEVMVTIDEMAIIRISGVYLSQYQTSQNWISIFRSPQQYIYSISNLSVTRYHSLSFIQNGGKWGFSATNGQLRIFRVDNPNKIVRYNYTAFTMTPGNLFDYNSNSLPYADFTNFQYRPRCSAYQNAAFQGPFTFTINPYWPQLRLLDQTGYEIISVRYPGVNCPQKLLGSQSCLSWFCPPNMFEHKGSCVVTCPEPYFHQISKENEHRCVLTCQADLLKDSLLRICSCSVPSLFACPNNTKATPLGCLCSDGLFYNPTNQDPNGAVCLSTCGPYLFSFSGGMCLPCPKNCVSCQLSSNSFSYLRCSNCELGYSLDEDGSCWLNCSGVPGQIMLNGSCLNCSVAYCGDCKGGIDSCSACMMPYALLNGSCVVTCPPNYKLQFRKDSTFECVKLKDCSASAVQVKSFNNQSRCTCLKKSAMVFTNCGVQVKPNCSLSQYWESGTKECLRCPVGCLTCELDTSGKIECTSCHPDYSLFITLAKNHYCERNSILSYCPGDYDNTHNICQLSSLVAKVAVLANRNLCLQNSTNCLICLFGSATHCSFCQNGYYLHQGQCLAECPLGSYPYLVQGVCLKRVIQQCLEEKPLVAYWLFVRTNGLLSSDGLNYLLSVNFQLIDPLNDPIGSLFSYSARSTSRSQIPDRVVNIGSSVPSCSRCQKGYGVTPLGWCRPCTVPCLQCSFSSESVTSCMKCDRYHRLVDNGCVLLNQTEMPCDVGQFRNESFICDDKCLHFYRSDLTRKVGGKQFAVNCTSNCPDGLSLWRDQGQLTCSPSALSQDQIKLFGSRAQIGTQTYYFFISSTRLIYNSSNIFTARRLYSWSRLLQESAVQTVITDFGFIVVDNSSSTDNTAVVIEINAGEINSDTGTLMGNSVYGYSSATVAPIDIIYNRTSNLYMYGRAFTVLLFIATVIFLGQELNYKTDNLFILFNVAYLTLTAINLQPTASGFNCYSFLYGFSWSSYLQMLSNPRDLSKASPWFNNYLDNPSNNAHSILFIDNNILRNCWSIFLFLIIFTAILLFLWVVVRCLTVKKLSHSLKCQFFRCWQWVGYNQADIGHSRKITLMLIFLIQNSFLPLIYYIMINLANSEWALTNHNSFIGFRTLSVILLIAIIGYSIVRWRSNRVGGIYCAKRIALGCVLGIASSKGGIDRNLVLTILLLLGTEIVFLLLRRRYELISDGLTEQVAEEQGRKKGRSVQRKKFIQAQQEGKEEDKQKEKSEDQKQRERWVAIIVEEVLTMVAYLGLALVGTVGEVALLFYTIVLMFFLGFLGLDIFQLGLQAWEQSLSSFGKPKGEKPYLRRIRTSYDHDFSMKSLAETTDF